MYGGYSVAGLTRQFVALKTVSSNLTTHPFASVASAADVFYFYIALIGFVIVLHSIPPPEAGGMPSEKKFAADVFYLK